MRVVAQWCGNLLADFVEDLASTPEADGTTMLANTLIVLFGEVRRPGVWPPRRSLSAPRAGASTNDFWLTVARQFDVVSAQFGNPADNRGPLARLFGS